ncbi:MAG: nicotinate phosphoribosyltransferase [Actinomycetota bacterium]|nr:nicotinate phosphoribosyltransferase [Actinomycetota bacterium]
MLQASLRSGAADQHCVFEVFARALPAGRRFGVVAGTGRLLTEIERFRFDAEDLEFLSNTGVVDERTCQWLADYRFSGDIDGYAEGEAYFPGSPILTVEASFGQAVLLETLLLSVLNHDSAVASAAARMTSAAGGRPCIEMGSRRTHEEAAVAAARAAYVAGFASTSNLEAGRRHGIPTTGTAAHAFVLVHGDERAAFAGQVEAFGPGTTLLVDTFDVMAGIRTAVEVAGAELGAIRLDSGDLLALAYDARSLLDELGATTTRIVVTSDLDEHAIAALAPAPIDAYGVGTSVVTGSGAPTAGFVYKLVARAAEPGADAPLLSVAKRSPNKSSAGGRKRATRRRDRAGQALTEILTVGDHPDSSPEPGADDRPLQVPLMRSGSVQGPASIAEARHRFVQSLAELPPSALALSRGEPAIRTSYQGGSRR